MPSSRFDEARLSSRLEKIYPGRAAEALDALRPILQKYESQLPTPSSSRWDQTDVVLITYGDQVHSDAANPLRSQLQFLIDQGFEQLIKTVHFLPCFPYSSDDGFSVIDYRQVDPQLGTWDDVQAYRESFDLMLDFVVNHVSQESDWFQAYLRGEDPYRRYFIEMDPSEDLSEVTRPRSLPLLSEFQTTEGPRHLWTTFSRDQLDLNYGEPLLLATMIDICLEYVSRGARILRLDAIAYLWKEVGTTCIHLEQTHQVVKLFRDILDHLAPEVLVLTETNVPHAENVSYFGDGDEAHMVYQFSLPPLLLDAFLNQDALPLKAWLAALQPPPDGATYFNFTASHDGVGVRPLEGCVDQERLASLVAKIREREGLVGTRRQPDGTDSPYELNISYVDALAPGGDSNDALHAQRFLTSQAVMLALQGMPAVYFHSLIGTQNDLAGVAASDIPRRINRHKYDLQELETTLGAGTLQHQIFTGMKRLLQQRIQQPAFHPDAKQEYVESDNPHVLSFLRQSSDQAIFVAANFHDQTQTISIPQAFVGARDLLGSRQAATESYELPPGQAVWLTQ